MKYFSTNNPGITVDTAQAVMTGLPYDGGLYMPVSLPALTLGEIREMSDLSYDQLAALLLYPYFGDIGTVSQMEEICHDIYNFEIPLRMFSDNRGIVELFHGPTLAFKDFGAGFLARLLGLTAAKKQTEITILVATSGDTGGAVANGFYGVNGIRVVILYPDSKVSPFQEQQIAGRGGNINAVRIKGTFDHCQMLVKKAFNDQSLNRMMEITSANSINIGRWIPQMVYYFYGWLKWMDSGLTDYPVFSVPSGNYGNIAAGMLASAMGLPVKQFVAASNINNTVPEFLRTGIYTPRESVHTVANAMDVGDPSNFVRMTALTKSGIPLNSTVTGFEFSDSEIIAKIVDFHDKEGYIADPHTATGILALEKYGSPGIVMGTAHPYKFTGVMPPKIRDRLTLPVTYRESTSPLSSTAMEPDYSLLKEYLITL
ncbi:MAG: threonine synthase [Bacteroidales bacterium]